MVIATQLMTETDETVVSSRLSYAQSSSLGHWQIPTQSQTSPVSHTSSFPVISLTNAPKVNSTALVIWTIIEPGIYLLSACALSFKPLLRTLMKSLRFTSLITHAKSTLPFNARSCVRKTAASDQVDLFNLEALERDGRPSLRLSEDSGTTVFDREIESEHKSFEAQVGKTIELRLEAIADVGKDVGEGYNVEEKDFGLQVEKVV